MSRALVAAAVLGVLSSARADVWQHAIDGKPVAEKRETYDNLLAHGDEAAVSANSKSISAREVRRNIDLAVEAYRMASKVDPNAAEPYFRIAQLLHAFYFDCEVNYGPRPLTCDLPKDQRMKDMVEAWDAFEKRAPLDPRINDILLERAINRTKLVSQDPQNKTLLAGALRDYKALLDRTGGLIRKPSYLVLGNLAETYMMLGMIDDAIDVYKDAVRAGGHTSVVYGLAVALDRDERGGQALALIRDRGMDELIAFKDDVANGQVFYVPAGEEHYYFALAEEAFGRFDHAAAEWRAYIKSGAHPVYQPRAKQHLTALAGKRNRPWRPPEPPDGFPRIDPP